MKLPLERYIDGNTGRVIREPEFARRLNSACDDNPRCPDLHRGRLVWLRSELKESFAQTVTVETVRKWFAGETKPRPAKLLAIADLLQVDVAWLSLGIDKGMAPRERKARTREISGAVNLVAGFIEMDGGHVAFPPEAEQNRGVDIHAIIRGAKYDFHIALLEDGLYRVPPKCEGLIVLGLSKRGFAIKLVEIPQELLNNSRNTGGTIQVNGSAAGLVRIESFAQRL